jgi:hypothetical protein
MKPRIKPEEIAWFQAFEKLRKVYEPLNAENQKLEIEGYRVWLNDDPAWVQLKGRKGTLMLRRGDSRLIEFVGKL